MRLHESRKLRTCEFARSRNTLTYRALRQCRNQPCTATCLEACGRVRVGVFRDSVLRMGSTAHGFFEIELLFLNTMLQRDAMVGVGVAAQTTAGNPKRHTPIQRAGPQARTNNTERKHTSKAQSSRQGQEAPNAQRSGGSKATHSTQ